MVDAPEKIWAFPWHMYRENLPGTVEYLRADIAERQIAELRAECLSANKDAIELARRLKIAEAENARLRALPLKDEAVRVLEPFADIAGEAWADENGWTVAACPNDRIRDWFGPSAFRAARSLLSRLRAGEQEGWQTIGYARAIDVDPAERPFEGKTSFWVSERQTPYYSVPVYLPAAPKQGEAK